MRSTLKAYFQTAALLLSLSWTVSLWSQTAQQVSGVAMTVADMDEALAFYTQILPFTLETSFTLEGKEIAALLGMRSTRAKIQVSRIRLGEESIELWEFPSQYKGKPIPLDSRSNDRWFQHVAIVVSDIDSAYQLLKQAGVQHVSSFPQTLPDYLPAAAGIAAFYFQDPDGHNLELIQFPDGKGNPKWQEHPEKLFVGIDHTAIGVSHTTESQSFYEGLLGLKVAGGSENYGTEQEHLNMVFGAHLQITGLVALDGPGVEFLEYLSPPGGRRYPAESQAWDHWHWHTYIQVPDIEQLYQNLRAQGVTIISKKLVILDAPLGTFTKAFMARDPDGHAVLITN